MDKLAQVVFILAIATSAIQAVLLVNHFILLAKAKSGKVSTTMGWGYASVAFWIAWVVLS